MFGLELFRFAFGMPCVGVHDHGAVGFAYMDLLMTMVVVGLLCQLFFGWKNFVPCTVSMLALAFVLHTVFEVPSMLSMRTMCDMVK